MKFLKCAIIAAITIVNFPAMAGEGSGLVRSIRIISDGRVVFSVDTHNDIPACGQKNANVFNFDGTTAVGKNKLAVLIAAANNGKSVSIYGASACLNKPNTAETALNISVKY